MMEIRLTRGKVALVDDEDFEEVSAHQWYAYPHRSTFYAERRVRHSDGKYDPEHMHVVILMRKLGRRLAPGMFPDHINGNGLDNRRVNLREATRAQNGRNCCRRSASPASQYLGVTWHRESKKWVARIRADGRNVYLGIFVTELEAAKAREAYIATRPELHARTNFPTSP